MIIIMDSIHQILKAEKILKKNRINIELIPVPKEIHSNCGSAIKIESSNNKEKLIKILKENNFKFRLFSYHKEVDFYIEEDVK